jgi:hypothetical protein
MRIWSIHPGYLDRMGLVALWRESLLAQKVLQGKTNGYKNHPQLLRFKNEAHPINLIGFYLYKVLLEASHRGYNFDFHRISEPTSPQYYLTHIPVTEGQVAYEWNHFLNKVKLRAPEVYEKHKDLDPSKIHLNPLFKRTPGDVEIWEKQK